MNTNMKLIKTKGRGADRTLPTQKGEASTLRIVLLPGQQYQDRRLHREDLKGFRIEVWQTGESRGTAAPKFYSLRFNLSLRRPQPCRSRPYSTLDRALLNARADVNRWRLLLDRRQGEKRPRTRFKEVPLRSEADQLEALATVADICRHRDPLCPVCSQQVNVSRLAGLLGATSTAY